MARRTVATIRRGEPHKPVEDPDAPGCCVRCKRPMDMANDMHVEVEDPPPPAPEGDVSSRIVGEGRTDG